MTPEQHQIYLRTYEMALSRLLLTCEAGVAISEAARHAHDAVKLYDTPAASAAKPEKKRNG